MQKMRNSTAIDCGDDVRAKLPMIQYVVSGSCVSESASHVRPQGAYLCANFFGSYGELPDFYAAFREMATDAQYRVSEPLYQIAAGPVFGSGVPFPMRLSAKLENAG